LAGEKCHRGFNAFESGRRLKKERRALKYRHWFLVLAGKAVANLNH
jgi:hypothetical protein